MSAVLRLYVVGGTHASERALGALDGLRAVLDEASSLEVVDLREAPHLAEEERILATPLLVRLDPPPVRRVAGDLSDPVRVLRTLGLQGGAA